MSRRRLRRRRARGGHPDAQRRHGQAVDTTGCCPHPRTCRGLRPAGNGGGQDARGAAQRASGDGAAGRVDPTGARRCPVGLVGGRLDECRRQHGRRVGGRRRGQGSRCRPAPQCASTRTCPRPCTSAATATSARTSRSIDGWSPGPPPMPSSSRRARRRTVPGARRLHLLDGPGRRARAVDFLVRSMNANSTYRVQRRDDTAYLVLANGEAVAIAAFSRCT